MVDPSTQLQLLKDPAKQDVYDLADTLCRKLTAAGGRGRTGYGRLGGLEKLLRSIAAMVPAGPGAVVEQSWCREGVHARRGAVADAVHGFRAGPRRLALRRRP